MSDLISRQAAIDAMCDACSDWCDEGVCKKVSAIQKLPPAQSERKTGEWISKGYGEYRCSSCRGIVDLDEEILMSIKSFDYCPYCGSCNGG